MTKILLIDNYDSFTYNLAQYLWELKYEVFVYRNDQITIEDITNFKPSHIVISPGPGTPNDSGICLEVLKTFHKEIPILGVCLGHQCIGQIFGATIERAPLPKHGKISEIRHTNIGVFKNLKNPFRATRYHSLIVNKESINQDILEITAESTDDHLVMGMRHREYPLQGVQFHPESIMTEHGHQLLQNFVEVS